MITKEQIIEALYKSAKKTETKDGILMDFLFADGADAVLNILKDEKNSNIPIQFAEWLSENEWVKRTKTHPSKIGQYYSHKHCKYKAIDDLFKLFISQS